MIIDLSSIGGALLSFGAFCLIVGIGYVGFKQNSKQHGNSKNSKTDKK